MLALADHLLAAVIVLGLPLRAFLGMRALRAAPESELSRLRARLWWRAIASQWTLVALVVALWIAEHRRWAGLGLALEPTAGLAGVLVGVVAMASIVLRQRGALATDATLRARVRARLLPVERLMPAERSEFARFVPLAITAGVCEELLFRGFLFWYAAQFLPLWGAAALQCVAFGVGHVYQGPKGILLTGLAGVFLTGVMLIAHSIAPAMLIHALMDLNAGDLALRARATAVDRPA